MLSVRRFVGRTSPTGHHRRLSRIVFRTGCTAAGSLLILLAATDARGQTNGSIIGHITDESGAVLPGVTVTASSPQLQVKEVAAVSESDGSTSAPATAVTRTGRSMRSKRMA